MDEFLENESDLDSSFNDSRDEEYYHSLKTVDVLKEDTVKK